MISHVVRALKLAEDCLFHLCFTSVPPRSWVGATNYHGRTVMRISVASWMTTTSDIETAARAIIECAAQVPAAVG